MWLITLLWKALSLDVFMGTKTHEKGRNTLFFISSWGQVLALKGACILKCFRAQIALRLLTGLTKSTNFKYILVIFKHSWLSYYIPLVKDQSSFYEIRCLAIRINIKAFNRVNRKQLNILETFLEYPEFYVVTYWRWFSPKSCITNYVPRASCLQTDCS